MAYITVFSREELEKYTDFSEYDKTKSREDWLNKEILKDPSKYSVEIKSFRIKMDKDYRPYWSVNFLTFFFLNHPVPNFIISTFFYILLPLKMLITDIYEQYEVCNNEYWVLKWWLYVFSVIAMIIVSSIGIYIVLEYVPKNIQFLMYMLIGPIIYFLVIRGVNYLDPYITTDMTSSNKYSEDYNYYFLIDYRKDVIIGRLKKIFYVPLLFVLLILCYSFLGVIFETITNILSSIGIPFHLVDLEKYNFYNVDKKSLAMYLNNYILFSMVAIGL